MINWFNKNGLKIKNLHHSFDIVQLSQIIKGIRYCGNIYSISNPKDFAHTKGVKLVYYKDHFMKFLGDGFIKGPMYKEHVCMLHCVDRAIDKFKVASHQLEVELFLLFVSNLCR